MARRPYPLPGLARFVAGFLLCINSVATAAPSAPAPAPGSYTLREWHEPDGLLSEDLAGVVQDKQGYLWVASNSELSRFDGTAFERARVGFEISARGLTQLEGTPAVPATRAGEVREAGYALLRDGVWQFQREEALAGKLPRSLFATKEGVRWIGCEDGTLLRREGDDVHVYEPPADLIGKKIPGFATDSSGQLWIVRSNHLFRIEGTAWTEVPLPSSEPELRIASSRTGGVWVFTRGTLLRWDGTRLTETARLPELAGAHFVQAAHEDAHGCLWIGTRSQGLFRICDREITPVPTSSEDVVSLWEDQDGNVWAATNGGGLSRLRPKAHQLFDQSSGLRDNFSYTVAEDSAGVIWLANRDGGMARIKDGVVDPISRRAGWRSFSTMSVATGPNGWIWITTGVGVFRTNAETPNTVSRVPALANPRNVRSSFAASNGDYWLAQDPDRVVRWRNDEVTTYGAEQGFDGREVRAFAEDSSGRIWIGAAEGRLYRQEGQRFERVPFAGDADCGAIQVIRFDAEGSILLGTTRRGVVIFPKGDVRGLRALDDSRGLPGSNISQILVDDRDRYWLASRTGIFWVHGADLRDFTSGKSEHVHAVILGKDDGLPDLSCLGLYQPAACKARDGTLWFATRRGVLRTNPAVMAATSESPPPVTIASIACDGVNFPVASELAIQSTVRKIQLRLSALNLSAPESVQVRYRLDGFDNDWTVLEQDRTVTYPRLPPGRYVLSTMASNGTGLWSNQPTQLILEVRPPWWQSVWAEFTYLVALMAGVALIVRRWSHRRLRLKLERAEQARAIEQERARIARNIHDDLGASLTRISLLTQTAQEENLGPPSPALEQIYEATHTITRSMDEIVWAVNPQHDNAESLIYYIGNYAQSFLGAAGIRCRIEAPSEAPEVALTSQTRHHLFLCCKEALNNVVKHSGATEVCMRISTDASHVTVAISDNGRGLQRDAPDGRRGNGLRNMESRMAEVRGACSVAENPGGGATISFTAPLQVSPTQ